MYSHVHGYYMQVSIVQFTDYIWSTMWRPAYYVRLARKMNRCVIIFIARAPMNRVIAIDCLHECEDIRENLWFNVAYK